MSESAIDRAAELMCSFGYPPCFECKEKARRIAGLLRSDADQAVLDAADAIVSEDSRGIFPYDRKLVNGLCAAVRARREAQP